MNEIDLYSQRREKEAMLERALTEAKQRGIDLTKAEKEYQIAKNTEILLLRAEGTPVTEIQERIRGVEKVAEKRQARDIAQVLYDSAKDAINVYKIEVRNLEADLEREWNNVERVHQ